MGRSFARSRPASFGLVALVLVLVLAKASGGPTEALGPTPPVAPWAEGRPQAIRVSEGRAAFDIPAAGPSGWTLVIVSALARQGGPFPIRLVVRPVERARPIDRAAGAGPRPVRLVLPPLAAAPGPVATLPPTRRTFHLLDTGGDVTRAASYRPVAGRLTAVGRRVQVYLDADDVGTVGPETMRDLVATFDELVYPTASRRFGPAEDVDGDGRFTVLFSGRLVGRAGGKGGVDGFVRGADLDLELGPPFGNRCDLMCLSTSLVAGPYLRTIVAHEYAHAVSFSRKALAARPGGLEEEGWLDEGVAHLVEDDLGFSVANIDYRVGAFLSRPERHRLVVDDYYAAGLFRGHGNRGATYLFLRWCVDRHGPGLLDALVRSKGRGVANLEAATGTAFADLFRGWTVALATGGLDPASGPEGGDRSIDPRGELGDRIRAGPRMAEVTPGGPGEAWSAEATTAHYAVIKGVARGGVAVEVVGPAVADLQVTAVRLPASSGRPELAVPPWRVLDRAPRSGSGLR